MITYKILFDMAIPDVIKIKLVVDLAIPNNENGFARAFGGAGGTPECGGGCPPGPPLCW